MAEECWDAGSIAPRMQLQREVAGGGDLEPLGRVRATRVVAQDGMLLH